MSFLLVNEKEMSLIKLVLYPRAIEVLLKLLAEKEIIRNFKYSEIIGYHIVTIIALYMVWFETMNLPQNFVRTVRSYGKLTEEEIMTLSALEENVTRMVNSYYHNK